MLEIVPMDNGPKINGEKIKEVRKVAEPQIQLSWRKRLKNWFASGEYDPSERDLIVSGLFIFVVGLFGYTISWWIPMGIGIVLTGLGLFKMWVSSWPN